MLQAVASLQHLRKLYSPAESMNCLSVGAAHTDASDAEAPVGHLDPYGACSLPSPISAVGLGYKRGIKPDLLAPGGRCPVELIKGEDGQAALTPYRQSLAPGVQVASPSPQQGNLRGVSFARGTSVACAFASHWATKFYDVLSDLRQQDSDTIDLIPRALWLKALLVHSSVWSEPYDALAAALRDEGNSRNFREVGARFLGYGHLEAGRGVECDSNRATALGAGRIAAEEKRRHRFPLPPSLGGEREWKRLSITLAWFTPINSAHQAWRRAHLWFDAAVEPLKVERNGAEHRAMRRGTVQHEVYDGEKAAVFVEGDAILIDVNCRPDAGALEEQVPYALAVTLEVREGVKIPIYEEVRTRIRPKVKVEATSEAGPDRSAHLIKSSNLKFKTQMQSQGLSSRCRLRVIPFLSLSRLRPRLSQGNPLAWLLWY
ncbi:MAG: S8 family serine peptidase [Myxococcales bacterium]|nr:S8 family serine peptidase [Myxococcales bacterium]